MINVLMIGPSRNVHGGISAVVNNLFEAGLNERVNLTYIGTMEEGSKFHKLLVAARAYFSFCRELNQFQIVHVNVASDSSYIRKSFFIRKAHRAGKHIIIHQHGGNFEHYYHEELNLSGQKKVRDIFSMADRVLVLSPKDRVFFSNICNESKVNVVSNSIPVPATLNTDRSLHSALFLGRICETKGVSELLRAADIIHQSFPDFLLYLGGIYEDEKYKSEIESRSEYVKFLGWLNAEERNRYLDECELFILPTYFEGQPVSVLEAMAHGCTVIASNVGGIPMMIQDGINGWLVEPKNVDALVSAVAFALEHPQKTKELASEAYQTVSDQYSISKTVNHLCSIYQEVLAND